MKTEEIRELMITHNDEWASFSEMSEFYHTVYQANEEEGRGLQYSAGYAERAFKYMFMSDCLEELLQLREERKATVNITFRQLKKICGRLIEGYKPNRCGRLEDYTKTLKEQQCSEKNCPYFKPKEAR